MVKYREILRLIAMGVSQESVAFSCGCAQSTVSDVIRDYCEPIATAFHD